MAGGAGKRTDDEAGQHQPRAHDGEREHAAVPGEERWGGEGRKGRDATFTTRCKLCVIYVFWHSSHIVNTSPPPSSSSSLSSSIRLKTFSRGLEFIQRNKDADEWCLLLETFDPHEPFFSQPEFHAM